MSEHKRFYLIKDKNSNRAILRHEGEKWASDVNGEPNEEWIEYIEYAALKAEKQRSQILIDTLEIIADENKYMNLLGGPVPHAKQALAKYRGE